jgi:hypothetical protein
MRTIKSEWEKFEEAFKDRIPKGSREVLEVAFYVGAATLLDFLLSEVTDGDEVQQEDMQMMERVTEELMQYRNMLAIRVARYHSEGEKTNAH